MPNAQAALDWYAFIGRFTAKLKGSSAFKFGYNTAPPQVDLSFCDSAPEDYTISFN